MAQFTLVLAALCLAGLLAASIVSGQADAPAAHERPLQVFLLGGQSNMQGVGRNDQLTAPYSQAFDKVQVWDAGAGAWVPLTPPEGRPSGAFGPEVAFAHAIAKAMPDERILLVKYAVGGTALYDDWAPTQGPQYIAFMQTARAALKNLDDAQRPYEIAGMLWLQGESDADESKGDLYEKNLTAFVAHMREQFKTPAMPFIIARVLGYYGSATGHAKLVRDAQVKVADADARAAWFDTDDQPLEYAGHYNAAGLIGIGNRFAESYVKLIAKPAK
ncbi:MAG: sialate O-acetylesterase [Phycisphaeraceae bacterium]